MKTNRRQIRVSRSLALATIFTEILSGPVLAQITDADPRELIKDLTHQTSARSSPSFIGCGEVTRDRLVARSLAQVGQAAIQPIEDAMDSLEQDGQRSRFARGAGWVLGAYAKIAGPLSDPRLQRMALEPKLAFMVLDIDISIAVEQSITSHVSSSQMLTNIFDCIRWPEPRHALDQLILAWERGDRRWMEATLGPNAKGALRALLKGRTWAGMREGIWRNHSSTVGVGYRFNNVGRWAEPWETFAAEKEYGPINLDSHRPRIETQFKTSRGTDCGQVWVQFVELGQGHEPAYLVDNADLKELLRTIAVCSVE